MMRRDSFTRHNKQFYSQRTELLRLLLKSKVPVEVDVVRVVAEVEVVVDVAEAEVVVPVVVLSRTRPARLASDVLVQPNGVCPRIHPELFHPAEVTVEMERHYRVRTCHHHAGKVETLSSLKPSVSIKNALEHH